MRALILAAGRGARLGDLTRKTPKPMLRLGGVPMLERIMRSICETSGIRDFAIVTGYLAEAIEDHFEDGVRFDWTVRYARQMPPPGVGAALNTARSLIDDAPFLLTYGDIIMDPRNYAGIIAAYAERTAGTAAVVGLNRVDDPWRGAAVYLSADGSIARIVEKPACGTSTTQWNNAGLFVFDPSICEYSSRVAPSPRGEIELPDAINATIADGHRAAAFLMHGDWRDVGTPEDYQEINAKFTNPTH